MKYIAFIQSAALTFTFNHNIKNMLHKLTIHLPLGADEWKYKPWSLRRRIGIFFKQLTIYAIFCCKYYSSMIWFTHQFTVISSIVLVFCFSFFYVDLFDILSLRIQQFISFYFCFRKSLFIHNSVTLRIKIKNLNFINLFFVWHFIVRLT